MSRAAPSLDQPARARRVSRRAFSLLELVIVMVILGTIAAIAVPRMGAAAERASDARLEEDLRRLQAACDFYTTEHGGVPISHGLSADLASTRTLVKRLVGTSDEAGTMSESGYLGPYLRSLPRNIYNNRQSVRIGGVPAGVGTHGWRLDPVTGVVEADHNTASPTKATAADALEAAVATTAASALDSVKK